MSIGLFYQAVNSGPPQLVRNSMPLVPNNSFKPTPHRGVSHVPTLR